MSDVLRILLVDDNPNDRALVARELEKEFSGVKVEQVPDASHWNKTLETGGFDLIITDFQLRWTTGLKILSQAKGRWPNTPVIMFTGTGGEEIAVEAMKNGLDDYIIKKPTHFLRLTGAARAVLEKQRRMQALRESERRLDLALESAGMGVWQWDSESNQVAWDDRVFRHFGIGKGEFDSTFEGFIALVDPRDRGTVQATLGKALENLGPYAIEFRVPQSDGSLRWISGDGRAYKSASSNSVQLLGVSQDITESKRADQLREGYNGVLTQLATGLELKPVLHSLAGVIEEHSPELFVSVLLLDRDGIHLRRGAAPRLPDAYNKAIDGVAIGPKGGSCGTAAFEKRLVVVEDITTDPLWADFKDLAAAHGLRACWSSPIISSTGAVLGTFALYFKTARKPVPAELELINSAASIARIAIERWESEAQLVEQAHLLDMSSDAIIVRESDRTVSYWNRGAEEVFRVSASTAMGKVISELVLIDPEEIQLANTGLERNGSWVGEFTGRRLDGSQFTVLSRWSSLTTPEEGRLPRLLCISTDITEVKRLEEQFLRSQRLESIGALASGIAHDLNNILTPILMSAELLKDEVLTADGAGTLATISESAQRGADIVKQVLMFAGGTKGKRLAVSPLLMMRDMIRIIRETFPKNLKIETVFEENLPAITADPTHLHQVLLNLSVNARDAMPAGGILRMGVESVVLDEHSVSIDIDAKPGRYVVLLVADNGCGIPESIRTRIFEPFFTTKETGKGTGLGLATCLAIVKSHGGFINLYSEFSKGTTFKIYLPAADSSDRIGDPEVRPSLPRGNGELILVVDDEPSILSVVARMLETFGYKVLTADSGPAAIAIYSKRSGEISVVLTDLMMPMMDGIALVHVLQKINPGVRVIMASGLAVGDAQERAIAAGIKHFLAKPFNAESVLEAVNTLLAK